jgi:hypothetical protein
MYDEERQQLGAALGMITIAGKLFVPRKTKKYLHKLRSRLQQGYRVGTLKPQYPWATELVVNAKMIKENKKTSTLQQP